MGIKILIFLLAGFLYAQEPGLDVGKFQIGGVGLTIPISSLSPLTSNGLSAWVGNSMRITNATDTANSQTIARAMFSQRLRFRQTCTVDSIVMYINDTSLITSFYIDYFRPASSTRTWNNFTLDRITRGEDLKSKLINGINRIKLTTSISVRDGDYYGIYVVGTGNGIAEPFSSEVQTYYFATDRTDTTAYDWSAGTNSNRYFGINFYSTTGSPILVLIGHSIIEGGNTSDLINRYASGISPNIYWNYDVHMTLGYNLGTYAGWTFQNMGLGGETSPNCLLRFDSTCIKLNPKLAVINTGINDNAALYSAPIVSNIEQMIDLCIANDIVPIVHSIMPCVNASNAFMQSVDTANTLLSAYCIANPPAHFINLMPVLGQARDTGTPTPTAGNLWDLKAYFYHTGDATHPNRNGNQRINREDINFLKTLYLIPDSANTPNVQYTSPTDTIIDRLTNFWIDVKAISFKGIDSATWTWNINSGTDSVIHLVNDSSGASTDYWNGVWNPNQAAISDSDICNWNLKVYGVNTYTTSGSFNLYTRKYTVDVDSLRAIQQWDNVYRGFYPNNNTYAQTMISLYTNNAGYRDTTNLGATSDAGADDPTDSTAFGFLYFDGNDRVETTQNVYTDTNWTLIMKVRLYSPNGYIFMNSYSSLANEGILLYSSTGNTINIPVSKTSEHTASWGIDGTDKVLALTSAGDLYINGALVKDNAFVSCPPLNLLLRVITSAKGRVYYWAWYNKIRTITEIQKWQ